MDELNNNNNTGGSTMATILPSRSSVAKEVNPGLSTVAELFLIFTTQLHSVLVIYDAYILTK